MSFLKRLLRLLKYKKLKKKNVFVCSSAVVEDSVFEGFNDVSGGTRLQSCHIGKGTYIKEDCLLKRVSIGRFCSIAPRVRLVYGEHPLKKNVSTHPTLYKGKPIAGMIFHYEEKIDEYKLVENYFCDIGSDVWICADVVIRGGGRIGNGAVVAAGSVVVKDVPPYAIVGGNPARVIRYRFSAEEISFLEKLEWWNKDESWLRDHVTLFSNIDDLKSAVLN